MGGTCHLCWGRTELCMGFCLGNLKEGGHVGDLGIDGVVGWWVGGWVSTANEH
jgi:hypothetical protein